MGYETIDSSLKSETLQNTKYNHKSKLRPRNVFLSFLTMFAVYSLFYQTTKSTGHPFPPVDTTDMCINPPPLRPPSYSDGSLDFLRTEYRRASLKKWQGAVQVPTISSEDFGPPEEDPVWEVFDKFHGYLERAFPLVHKHLKREKVHKYGLVFTWKGSDSSVKPALLTGHQDVVPVSEGKWKYPPFSAHFDGKNVWGRGVSDDKHSLVSILEAAELLLSKGYEPSRDILFAFGYDEESSGKYGAGHIGPFLEERYGHNSFELILDEGGNGVSRVSGTNVALVAVGEKGRYAADITLHTPGGHGSAPPDHTAIGIVSKLVSLIEDTPHSPILTSRNPMMGNFQCYGVHSTDLDPEIRQAYLNADRDDTANRKVIDHILNTGTRRQKYMIQTSQAVDVIEGGVKINALPEKVVVRVDNRIAPEFTAEDVKNKLVKNCYEIAKQFGVGLQVNGVEVLPETAEGYFEFSPYTEQLEPAPLSQTSGETWNTFAGTIRHVYEDFGGKLYDDNGNQFEPENIVVAPTISTGNTDTSWYWNLSENIYRFSPSRNEDDRNIHGTNEHMSLDNHIDGVAFYYEYLQNL